MSKKRNKQPDKPAVEKQTEYYKLKTQAVNDLVTGMALGIVTDLLTNPVLRFFEKTKGENARWMMVSRKTYSSFFLNILYAYVVLFLVYVIYNVINLVAARITGVADRVVLGVEPILFGVFCLGVDLLLIQVKHLIGRAFRPAGKKPIQ